MSRYNPKAFTWEGCNMLATILQSEVATQRAIQIVRGFTAIEKQLAQKNKFELAASEYEAMKRFTYSIGLQGNQALIAANKRH